MSEEVAEHLLQSLISRCSRGFGSTCISISNRVEKSCQDIGPDRRIVHKDPGVMFGLRPVTVSAKQGQSTKKVVEAISSERDVEEATVWKQTGGCTCLET